mgnify:CR=1 FL=1
MTTTDASLRARRIRLVLFDVDGVLTDGMIWFFPTGRTDATPADGASASDSSLSGGTGIPAGSMVEVKGFNAHDGIGLTLARRAGLKTGVITKRVSESLTLRARDLRMDYVRQGVERKREALEAILVEAGVTAEETCCMGDDIIDLPMLQACGLAAAPSNARPEVLRSAHFVAAHKGGDGAARDLIEFILREQQRWTTVAAEYVQVSEQK